MAQEKRVAHIHGINERGQLFTIAVYRKDGATRLSYLAESHYVQPNEDTIAGWRDMAARTWGLRRIALIAASSIGSNSEKEELANLMYSGRPRWATAYSKRPPKRRPVQSSPLWSGKA